MKYFKLPIYIFIITVSGFSRAEKIDEAIDSAEAFFNEQIIVNPQILIRPKDLIGSLIYFKKGKESDWEYVKIVPQEILEKIEPKHNNKIILQTMASHETVADAKYLSFFKAKVKKENLLQVILEDLYDLEAPSFLNNETVNELVTKWGTSLIISGHEVFYVDRVNVTSLTARTFEKGEQVAGFNFYVEGTASNFKSTDKFKEKTLISLHRNNINIFSERENKLKLRNFVGLTTFKGEDYIPNLTEGKLDIDETM